MKPTLSRCRHVELPPGTYDTGKRNSYIMALPLGEAHAALDRVELEGLPRLWDTFSLNDHMQANFVSLLLNPERDRWEFTKPALIKRQHLARLEGWRDWRTLSVYLRQWVDRIRLLRDLGFILTAEGAAGEFSRAVVINPHIAIKRLWDKRHPGLVKKEYELLIDRALEVGATEADHDPKAKFAVDMDDPIPF